VLSGALGVVVVPTLLGVPGVGVVGDGRIERQVRGVERVGRGFADTVGATVTAGSEALART